MDGWIKRNNLRGSQPSTCLFIIAWSITRWNILTRAMPTTLFRALKSHLHTFLFITPEWLVSIAAWSESDQAGVDRMMWEWKEMLSLSHLTQEKRLLDHLMRRWWLDPWKQRTRKVRYEDERRRPRYEGELFIKSCPPNQSNPGTWRGSQGGLPISVGLAPSER